MVVNHSENEYVRGDVSTNTIGACFSVFKRGMNVVYPHCYSQHLLRYLAEFEFRYNDRVALQSTTKEESTMRSAALAASG
jgi:ISXO2-like transposase domain